MMAKVEVSPIDEERFQVTIDEETSTSSHEVTATAAQVERIAPRTEPGQLVEASVRFLLDREPKESIMSRFDLDVISRFFPEYESTVKSYL